MTLSEFPLIILAAGKSSRMGEPKGLLTVSKSKTLLDLQIEKFKNAGGIDYVIVIGYDMEHYLAKYPILTSSNFVINRTPQKGPFSSLQLASQTLCEQNFPAAFVLPIDVPIAESFTLERLAEAYKLGAWAAIPRFSHKGGHPVLLRREFLERLNKLDLDSPDARLDHQIRHLPKDLVHYVESGDEKVTMNLNSKDEWHKFMEKL